MAFDASGTFTRTAGVGADGSAVWQDDAAAGTKILASRHDTHDQDIAAGLSQCILRNGAGAPTDDIPWGGKKITNLGEPTAPQDVATKHYVDNPDAAQHARAIEGADLDGRLNFTALSGTNGITWTYADLSWVARGYKAGEALNRLVLNNSVNPPTNSTSGDVFVVDEQGHMNIGGFLMWNGAYDGQFRTVTPGFMSLLDIQNGNYRFHANDVATISNPYAVAATLRPYFTISNSAGSVSLITDMNGNSKTANWSSTNAGVQRWLLRMGNGTAESGTAVGSDFDIHAYNNAGGYIGQAMRIERANLNVSFGGKVTAVGDYVSTSGYFVGATTPLVLAATGTGQILLRPNGRDNTTGQVTIGTTGGIASPGNIAAGGSLAAGNGQFNGGAAVTVLSAAPGGQIFFRPNGAGSNIEESYIDTNGDTRLGLDLYVGQKGHTAYGAFLGAGMRMKAASNGAYSGAYWFNSLWNGTNWVVYANQNPMGTVTMACDYRIKKDITPLASMWEAVKRLNPIRYTQQEYSIWINDDTPRFGFVAHELQETLTQSAATGTKDGEDVQGPDLMAVVAALTKALQEAMGRIEALESAA